MINDLVKKQLDKVLVADLSNYNEATNEYFIPRAGQNLYELNRCYIVEVDPGLLNSGSSFAITMNRGTAPTFNILKIAVFKINGKLLYCNTLGYDLEKNQDINFIWSGWLPAAQLKLIKKL